LASFLNTAFSSNVGPASTCRVELHWRLGPGADHGRMARIVAEYNVFGWLAEAARS
jgi:hypothetical protein